MSLPALILDPNYPLPPFDLATAEFFAWHDRHRHVVALGQVHAQQAWIHVTGLASYHLDAGDAVIAVPVAGADVAEIHDRYYRTVLPLALQLRGRLVLHASGVVGSDGVVGFLASSRTGKSTLAYALARRGYPSWTDDALLVGCRDDTIVVEPLPFHVRLRTESAAHFRSDLPRAPDPTFWNNAQAPAARPLQALYLLERANDADFDVDIAPTPAAEGLTALTEQSYLFELSNQQQYRRYLQQHLAVAARVPLFRLRFQPDLRKLDALCDALAHHLLGAPPSPQPGERKR